MAYQEQRSNIAGSIGTEAAGRQSHVKSEMDSLEKQIQRMKDGLQQLEQRLSPVLRSIPPQPNQGAGKVAEVMVPLAECIRGYSSHVYDSACHIESLLDRLEV